MFVVGRAYGVVCVCVLMPFPRVLSCCRTGSHERDSVVGVCIGTGTALCMRRDYCAHGERKCRLAAAVNLDSR